MPQDATSRSTPLHSMSMLHIILEGIKLSGPIALTDLNSLWQSGSGHLEDTLTSIWGNTPPSAGPSTNFSVLTSPLKGLLSCSALLSALKPLAPVLEGLAIAHTPFTVNGWIFSYTVSSIYQAYCSAKAGALQGYTSNLWLTV